MSGGNIGPNLRKRWYQILVTSSAVFVLVTFAAYASEGNGMLSRLLFVVGLGGENNIGAWWSGMLLLLAAALAFDGYRRRGTAIQARRGWLALSGVLLLLSFDEVASLHEYLLNTGLLFFLPFALLGAGLTAYALTRLMAAGVGRRVIYCIVLAFVLFATIPVHEYIQQTGTWNDPLVYGLRAAFEEGTELAAIVILVGVTRRNTRALLDEGVDGLAAAAELRAALMVIAALLIPALTAATFVLPFPGGPADWLAASLYLLCGLHVVREFTAGRANVGASAALLSFYVGASAMAVALKLEWDPVVGGVAIGLRGVVVACLLLVAIPLFSLTGRRPAPFLFGIAAMAALAGSLRPESQALWCAVPPTVALWLYSIESRAVSSVAEATKVQTAAA